MPYAWSPMPYRKPLKLPDGKRLAVIITANAEYWDPVKPYKEHYYAGGPPVIPDPLPGDVFDSPNFTWREYGQRVGIWRCFDVAAKAGVPPVGDVQRQDHARAARDRRHGEAAAASRWWRTTTSRASSSRASRSTRRRSAR